MLKSRMHLGLAGFLLVIIVCWATSADARYRRYYKYYRSADPSAETQRHGDRYRYSRRQRGEERREAQSERNEQSEQSERQGESGRGRRGSGTFSAIVEQLIRVCGQQGVELKNWPFDSIAQTVRPDDTQRNALEELGRITKQTADTLAADCPREIPAAPSARLDQAQRGMESAIAALKTVQPAMKTFYGSLDDEQKARLLAKSLTASMAQERSASQPQERSGRRSRSRSDGGDDREVKTSTAQWDSICGNWAAALRDWPVTRIERNVGLSETQRIAFYEVVASSMKAAGALIASCPTEAALTPVGRMETLRKRLEAMHQATVTIHPALVAFYEGLDNKQKTRFAEMN